MYVTNQSSFPNHVQLTVSCVRACVCALCSRTYFSNSMTPCSCGTPRRIIYSGWLKSLHTWGKCSLYLQNVVYMDTITLIAHIAYVCVSPTHGELSLTHLVVCAHMHLWCFLLSGPYFASSPGLPWPSNTPTSKNQVGWSVETSGATPRDHGDQFNDLETPHLSTMHADTNTQLIPRCVFVCVCVCACVLPTVRTCLLSDDQVNAVVSRKI